MRCFFLTLFVCFLSLATHAQTAMADITGVWKGNFYQENFLKPGEEDLAYKAVMTIEQHGDEVKGTCIIFWYDTDSYWGKWSFSGNYENGKFNYTEYLLDEDHCKPGFSWCLKEVESMIQYNPATAQWLLSGNFKGNNGFFECAPGTLFFVKEGDI